MVGIAQSFISVSVNFYFCLRFLVEDSSCAVAAAEESRLVPAARISSGMLTASDKAAKSANSGGISAAAAAVAAVAAAARPETTDSVDAAAVDAVVDAADVAAADAGASKTFRMSSSEDSSRLVAPVNGVSPNDPALSRDSTGGL